MALPFFYFAEERFTLGNQIILDEAVSKHIVQALRMQNGEKLILSNGNGIIATCIIADNHRKKCTVEVINAQIKNPPQHKTIIAVSPIKNSSRFEWFLEKATEIGVSEIAPLLCSRTEKQSLKPERAKNILVSAMLQSSQCRLPLYHEPVKFENYMDTLKNENTLQKFIAHCENAEHKFLLTPFEKPASSIILIGPEGDFTAEEIQLALQHNFTAVSLGQNRLRTETAALVASVLLALK